MRSLAVVRRPFGLALSAVLGLASVVISPLALAQSADTVKATARFKTVPALTERTTLEHHVPLWATESTDLGSLNASTRMTDMHLVLQRAPEVEAAFEQLLTDQQNPASARYHQWLTPAQNAAEYGIAASDLAVVTNWLQSSGLTVDSIAAGGVFITFSGTAAAVESAFSAPIHNFSVENVTRYSITSAPRIPSALTGILQSVSGLSQNLRVSHAHVRALPTAYQYNQSAQSSSASSLSSSTTISPSTTFSDNSHALAPGDFNIIYDIAASINSGINGTGASVGNIIDSRIYASDISSYESLFGLPTNTVNQILVTPKNDPGVSSGTNGSEGEALLDVQRIIGTAPKSTVNLLVIGDLSDSSIFTALQYEISTLNDNAVNMSFGGCDTDTTAVTDAQAYESYYKTATAQGISIFNSSGDDGVAGCNSNYKTIPATQVQAANLLCMSGYVTCVGGTEFADASSPSTYWSSTNNSTTKASALSYIPEGAWNEPTYTNSNNVVVYQGSATGGGPGLLPKPTWQTGTGVPADSLRDTPDIAFSASDYDGYLICQADISNKCSTGSFAALYGGTSASSPSMAGIAALLAQKTGSRQGNFNPLLYGLFNGSSSSSVFHDATIATSAVSTCVATTPSMCNNSTPSATSLSGGLAGYLLQTGYDMATGLGSLDVGNFLTAANNSTTTTTLALTASSDVAVVGSATTLTATLSPSTSSGTAATGTVTFYTVSGTTLTSIGTGTLSSGVATLSYTFATAGTYTLRAIYAGDSDFATATSADLTITVNNNTFTITPATLSYPSGSSTLLAGTTVTDLLTVASSTSFSGTVAYTCSTSDSTMATCSVSPASSVLTAGGSATPVLTINTVAGKSGTVSVIVTGTSGTEVVTSPSVSLTLTPPSFTITPATTTLAVIGGSTTATTTTLTVTSVNGYAGTVSLACQPQSASGTGQSALSSAGSCSATSVTLAAGSSATSTLSVTANAGVSNFYAHLTGTGATSGITTSPAPTADVAITVNAPITLSASPASLSFTSGATTGNTSTITVAAQSGVSGTVTLSCALSSSTATSAPSCAMSPTSVSLTSGGTATSTLSISSTTAHTQAQTQSFAGFTGWRLGALSLALLGGLALRRRKGIVQLTAVVMLALGLTTLTGCGGSAPKNTFTSAGNYTATVTASYGSYTTTTTVSVAIQ
ncbi:MAG: protease pro-enzyme activation domain-containing protein [Acidobacteriaceae bacterium]|nr:protease pro-enzyme activation domain-containing protein [Acidobacteriaceae bacterium]